MSLINKMLQDLDARGGHGGAANALKSVPLPERRKPRRALLFAAGVLGLLLLAAVVAAGVIWYRTSRAPKPPSVIVQPIKPQLDAAAPAPARAPAAVASPAPARQEIVVVDAPPVPANPVNPVKAPAPQNDEAEEPVATPARAAASRAVEEAAPAGAEDSRIAATPVRAADGARAGKQPPSGSRAGGRTVGNAQPAATVGGRDMTPAQRAESEYRRATTALQEGRIREAIQALEEALALEPQHEAARQTLVGLLLEARRNDDAIRVLQTGLTLDPRQPNLAMLLARLQIERGGPAIETLQRTLPHAAGNGEYHAFLAGALQRAGRHREAIEQYDAALRALPQQSVWLMGLGISLLAEKRNPEALAAFRRAKAAGGLTPELDSFVERKLQQLAH